MQKTVQITQAAITKPIREHAALLEGFNEYRFRQARPAADTGVPACCSLYPDFAAGGLSQCRGVVQAAG